MAMNTRLGPGNEVHRAAHAFQHFAGMAHWREFPFIDLQRAENSEIDVAANESWRKISRGKIDVPGSS